MLPSECAKTQPNLILPLVFICVPLRSNFSCKSFRWLPQDDTRALLILAIQMKGGIDFKDVILLCEYFAFFTRIVFNIKINSQGFLNTIFQSEMVNTTSKPFQK